MKKFLVALGAASLLTGLFVATMQPATAGPAPASELDGVVGLLRTGWTAEGADRFGALARAGGESVVQLQGENPEYWQQRWEFEAVDAGAGVYRLRNHATADDGVSYYLSRAGDTADVSQPGSDLYLAELRGQSAQLWTVTVEDMGGWERYQLLAGWESSSGTLTVPGFPNGDGSWSRGEGVSVAVDAGMSSQRWTLQVIGADPGPTTTTQPPTTQAPTTQPPTTSAPTTQAPTTTSAPTTQPPTTQAPTTTSAPTTQPPTTQPPTGGLPTGSVPAWNGDLSKPTELRGVLAKPALTAARYIDCDDGDDGAAGTGSTTAWRSLTKARGLPTGTDVVLAGTCSGQQLVVDWAGTSTDPVVITGRGTGDARPVLTANGNQVASNAIIQVTRPHVEIWDVIVDGQPVEVRTSPTACHVGAAPSTYEFGYLRGISIEADNTLVARVEVSGTYSGVYIDDRAASNVVAHSILRDNQIMTTGSGGDDDAGAMGALIRGDDNEVAWNYFSGNRACSPDYGIDGSSVEIFNGSGNHIHNNMSHRDHIFTELGEGGGNSANNTFDYNTWGSDVSLPVAVIGGRTKQLHDSFLVTRWGGEAFGRIDDTTARNNLVYALGQPGDGIVCGQCVPAALSAGGNEFHVTRHEFSLFNGGANTGTYARVPALPGSPGAGGR